MADAGKDGSVGFPSTPLMLFVWIRSVRNDETDISWAFNLLHLRNVLAGIEAAARREAPA
jgi:hypothetical protein